jgi:protein TonB
MMQRSKMAAIGGSFFVHALLILLLAYQAGRFPAVQQRGDASPLMVDLVAPEAPGGAPGASGSQRTAGDRHLKSSEPFVPDALPLQQIAPAGGPAALVQPVAKFDSGTVAGALAASAKTGSAPAVAGGEAFDAFRSVLLSHIQHYRDYSQSARDSRAQGVVLLHFAMNRNGDVIDVWVEHSSGQVSVDAAAIATVRRAQPLPRIPDTLPDRLSITFPLSFELT